MIKGRSIYN